MQCKWLLCYICIISLFLFLASKIFLKGRMNKVRYIEHSKFWPQLEMDQAEARDQELPPGLQWGWQELKDLSRHLLVPRCICRSWVGSGMAGIWIGTVVWKVGVLSGSLTHWTTPAPSNILDPRLVNCVDLEGWLCIFVVISNIWI